MPALRTRATHPPVRSIGIKTAPLPSLEIIAPTPRTVTFPSGHNLSDGPYHSPSHSPSHSPFEHDLRVFDSSISSPSTPVSSYDGCHSAPPLSAFTRTVFPVSEPQSPSPVRPMVHQSSRGGIPTEERRPKKGDGDYVKRPENSFILFRRQCSQDMAAASSNAPSPSASSSSAPSPPSASTPPPKKYRQADLSRIISQRWKALTAEERAYWEALAQEKKREHEQRHPNYVYRPRRPKKASNSPAPAEPPSNSSQYVAPIAPSPPPPQAIDFVLPPAQAPTLPPYQAFQVPTVNAPPASAPSAVGTSANDPTNLMAMIHHLQCRLQSYEFGGGFDYVPINSNLGNLEMPTLLSPSVEDIARSPASSSSPDSSPSPYTPCAAFPPAVFTAPSPASFADAPAPLSLPGDKDDMGLGLYDPAPAADSWLGSSPWPSTSASYQPNFDFDLTQIPGAELAFPGGDSALVLPGGCVEFGFPLAFEAPGSQRVGGELQQDVAMAVDANGPNQNFINSSGEFVDFDHAFAFEA
ncbi:hypothetical protein C8R45DRAFT_1213037 [Mycena sanguinolenta]|nr:hypothetical protein C8R45DRAFT_1213037 [Mycena sanguinolenta]